MYNKLFVVCLLLAVAAELMEGKTTFHKRKIQKNSIRSHYHVAKRQSECSSDQFLCVNSGRCISDRWICDSDNDCGDGSDEPEDCLTRDCPEGYVKCSNGQCLNTTSYCSGDARCQGEALVVSNADCPIVECGPDQFACGSGTKCVPKTFVCDRDNDCGDRSDEQNCEERVCADDEVRCQSGQCLNKLSYCVVGWASSSCRDGSTPSFTCLEFTCPSEDYHSRCASNGKCVTNSFRCDGNNNCDDGSDEDDCPPVQCGPGYARCPTRNRCISTLYFCDSDNDCGDNSDEQNCDERVCADDEVRCQSGQCLSKLSFCTSSLSCRGGSSPIGACADFTCPEDNNYFKCVSDGKCVWNSSRCDGFNHCDDGSDEADCQGVKSEPEPDIARPIPVRYMCMMSVERECPAPNFDQHFVGLQTTGDVFSKLAQIDLRELCTPLQEFGDCAVTSFDNSQYCQDPALSPDLRLMREFGPRVLTYICEENIEVINREKSCLLKLNEQNQPVMMFKLMMSCAPHIVAAQSHPQEDIYCIPAELQQCAKNAIAEECGDDIATVANGLADLIRDFCEEMQTLRSAPPADPVEQPSYQTYMKRHVRDFARVRKMMKSIF